MKKILLVLSSALLLVSCGTSSSGETDFEFPEVVAIDSLEQTEFVATLESELSPEKNSVYAVTMLLAWDQFRTVFGSPLVGDSTNNSEFIRLIESRSFSNVLDAAECELNHEVHDDGTVEVYAAFSKSLPFKNDMHHAKNGLDFFGTRVSAFGILHDDEPAREGASILYYGDDDHFVIRLLPKDRNHSMILSTGIDMNGSFSDLLARTMVLIDSGDRQLSNPMTAWRRAFNVYDTLMIPCIQFNLQKSWSEFIGQRFTAPNGQHTIVSAEQRTAFVLNEHGAAIESEDWMLADSIAPIGEEPHPKRLYCNKPFFLYAIRTDAAQPYFALKVETRDLMELWKPKGRGDQ